MQLVKPGQKITVSLAETHAYREKGLQVKGDAKLKEGVVTAGDSGTFTVSAKYAPLDSPDDQDEAWKEFGVSDEPGLPDEMPACSMGALWFNKPAEEE